MGLCLLYVPRWEEGVWRWAPFEGSRRGQGGPLEPKDLRKVPPTTFLSVTAACVTQRGGGDRPRQWCRARRGSADGQGERRRRVGGGGWARQEPGVLLHVRGGRHDGRERAGVPGMGAEQRLTVTRQRRDNSERKGSLSSAMAGR